jgi:protein-S-isoprenylcysteine O-methyltransferase Ste14
VAHRTTAWLLVTAQFVLIGAVVLGPGEHWAVSTMLRLASWVLVAIAGALGVWAARWLGKGLTPLPLPNGQTDLVTSGPYRWVRHPMYSAVIIGMSGIALRSGSWWSAAAWLGLVALLAFKSRWEEGHLVAAFSGYAEYRKRTGRFVPTARSQVAGGR